MSRDDEIKKWAHNQIDPEFINEDYLDGLMEGARWADSTMLDKVCEWLNKNITNYKSDMMGYIEYSQISDIIQDLRKTMEG